MKKLKTISVTWNGERLCDIYPHATKGQVCKWKAWKFFNRVLIVIAATDDEELNARIAAHLLSAGISSRVEATHCMTRMLTEQPPVTRYERRKLTDEEVTEMIACRLAQAPGTSASRLLREFRDAGYACEQQRFGGLYRIVTGAGP